LKQNNKRGNEGYEEGRTLTQARLRLVFSEEERPLLLNISSLLYDFELLHDFSLLICAEDYSDYRFSRNFWYRTGRPIKIEHRLRAAKIVKESPLTVELIIAAVPVATGALWVLLQAIEKVQNWRLNREKLRLEIDKLRLEKVLLRVELEQKLHEREVTPFFNVLIKRLDSIPIKLADFTITSEENDKGN
jgi:hypothetical protein